MKVVRNGLQAGVADFLPAIGLHRMTENLKTGGITPVLLAEL